MTPASITIHRFEAKWVYLCMMEKYRELQRLNSTAKDEDVVADAANDMIALGACIETLGAQFNRHFGEAVFNISDRRIS